MTVLSNATEACVGTTDWQQENLPGFVASSPGDGPG